VEEIAAYPGHTAEQIEGALGAAQTAQRGWPQVSFAERRDLMLGAARLLRSRGPNSRCSPPPRWAKPLAEADAEVDKCALTCDFYAEKPSNSLPTNGSRPRRRRVLSSSSRSACGRDHAVEFPFWQVVRFAAPALMAGNGALLSTRLTCPVARSRSSGSSSTPASHASCSSPSWSRMRVPQP
jgi:succinate-semialdehyde dehydrogenase/glutarate-semialdehyde dehydrogenase